MKIKYEHVFVAMAPKKIQHPSVKNDSQAIQAFRDTVKKIGDTLASSAPVTVSKQKRGLMVWIDFFSRQTTIIAP
jgi:hypothetical protein